MAAFQRRAVGCGSHDDANDSAHKILKRFLEHESDPLTGVEIPAGAAYMGLLISQRGGALDGLVVQSGFSCRPADLQRGCTSLLSLHARSVVWSPFTLDPDVPYKSLELDASRGDAQIQHPDLAQAARSGCGVFLALTEPLDGPAAPGDCLTLLLAFTDRAHVRQSTLRAARELLAAMTACEQCRQGVQRTAVLVASLLAPAPPPSGGGLDLDLELDTEEGWSDSQHGSDGAWSDSDGEEGGAARRGLGASRPWPSQERLGEEGGGGGEGASSVLSLRFYDPQAEQAFSHWYNCFMLKVDAFGYALCQLSVMYIMYMPGAAFQMDAKSGGSLAVRLHSQAALAPGVLLLHRRTRAWYIRHREWAVAFTFAAAAHWAMYHRHYADIMLAEDFKKWFFFWGYSWLGITLMLFQLRWCFQLPMALATYWADTRLLPGFCAQFAAGTPAAACMRLHIVRVVKLNVLVPLTIIYLSEARLRRLFRERRARGQA